MAQNRRTLALTLIGGALLATAAACGSTADVGEPSVAEPSVAEPPTAPAPTAGDEPPEAAAAGPIAGPCDLLTDGQIASAVGMELGAGAAKIDDARQVQTCTWTTDDLTTIVVVGLTDVAAEEAYQTNVDLAPAYFDGDPVETTVAGADRAYAVEQPDVGWVVGAIAGDRFVQVQVGGYDITQTQAESLATAAVARLAS